MARVVHGGGNLDGPSWPRLLLTGALAFGGGLGAVAALAADPHETHDRVEAGPALADALPEPTTPPTAPPTTPTAEPEEAESPSSALEAAALAPPDETESPATEATGAIPNADPKPDDVRADDTRTDDAPHTDSSRSMTPGRVAYLRCDGIERPGRVPPCPRDEAFELAVWNALADLGRCDALRGAAGEGDVRFEFRTGSPPSIYAHSPRTDSGTRLPSDTLVRCVETALPTPRTDLASDRLVVSFQLALR